MQLTEAEHEFIEQAQEFEGLARDAYDGDQLSGPDRCSPLTPIVVDSLSDLDEASERAIMDALSNTGVVHVVPESFERHPVNGRHPMLALTERLAARGAVGVPIDHPMESHPEALARFGDPDGTLKIYDLPIPAGGAHYREQAETNEMFDAHNDGLGYAGLVYNVAFCLDSAPLAGGYTFFQDAVNLGLRLAETDRDAFKSLFLPDVITAVRPRGKGAIKVQAPVLFLGRDGRPQAFFRDPSGEYRIIWREGDWVDRARRFLTAHTQPFAPSSQFVHLVRQGETVLIDNRRMIHGRTPFTNPKNSVGRVLARKWFVPTETDAVYRHVPAVEVDHRYAAIFPEIFADSRLNGDWHYDATLDANIKLS